MFPSLPPEYESAQLRDVAETVRALRALADAIDATRASAVEITGSTVRLYPSAPHAVYRALVAVMADVTLDRWTGDSGTRYRTIVGEAAGWHVRLVDQPDAAVIAGGAR